MNKSRRADVDKARSLMEEALGLLESSSEAEREAFDNLNEGLAASESGLRLESNAENLEEAKDEVESAIAALDNIEGGE